MEYGVVYFMVVVMSIAGLALYFLPTILGWNKKDRWGIFVLNLFGGWTAFAWVIALIWALKSDDDPLFSFNVTKNVNVTKKYD